MYNTRANAMYCQWPDASALKPSQTTACWQRKVCCIYRQEHNYGLFLSKQLLYSKIAVYCSPRPVPSESLILSAGECSGSHALIAAVPPAIRRTSGHKTRHIIVYQYPPSVSVVVWVSVFPSHWIEALLPAVRFKNKLVTLKNRVGNLQS